MTSASAAAASAAAMPLVFVVLETSTPGSIVVGAGCPLGATLLDLIAEPIVGIQSQALVCLAPRPAFSSAE